MWYTAHTIRYLGILVTDLQLTTIFFLSSCRYFLLAAQLLFDGTWQKRKQWMRCPQDGGLRTEPSHFAAKELKILWYDGACIRIQVPFRRSLLATSTGQFIPPRRSVGTHKAINTATLVYPTEIPISTTVRTQTVACQRAIYRGDVTTHLITQLRTSWPTLEGKGPDNKPVWRVDTKCVCMGGAGKLI
jgi:hypothetical protein